MAGTQPTGALFDLPADGVEATALAVFAVFFRVVPADSSPFRDIAEARAIG
jgi:hypothetical protein